MLKEILQDRIEECNPKGCYCMCVKPYFREVILNPSIFEQGDNLFVISPDGSRIFNIHEFHETYIGFIGDKVYERYDLHKKIDKYLWLSVISILQFYITQKY